MLLASAAHNPFVADMTIVLVVAAVTSIVFRRLGQSSVLAYLLAGLIVGPYIPVPLFADPERIGSLAEFGVILVMFSVGTEFNLRRLLALLMRTGFAAIVQMAAMAWLGHAFGGAIGLDPIGRLFLGAALAISSTMVVAKVFDEASPEPEVRELVFGILVIQDIAAVVLIAVLTAVGRGASITAGNLGSTVVEVVGVLVGLIVVGLFVVPRLVRVVGRLESREHMVVTSGALAFGLAWVAQSLDYSVALGAFLAGMLASESGRVHDIEHVVEPIRDLFAAVFFVSVGMSVDPVAAWHELSTSLPLAVVVVVAQLVVVSGASLLSGNGLRRSVMAGAALGQIGEFAFIMAGVGTAAGVVPASLYPVVVTVAVVTAFTTPMVFRVAAPLATALDQRMPAPLAAVLHLYESWLERLRAVGVGPVARVQVRRRLWVLAVDGLALAIIVFVAGRFASELAIWCETVAGTSAALAVALPIVLSVAAAVPFVISAGRTAKRIGVEVGEAMLPVPTRAGPDLGRAPRRLLTVCLQLVVITGLGLPLLVIAQPLLPRFVTAPVLLCGVVIMGGYLWRTANDLGGHVKAASQVVLELLEAQTLSTAKPDEVETLLPGMRTLTSVAVDPDSEAVGRSLADLDLSCRTGAAVLAIYRPDGALTTPAADTVIAVGDVLGIVGTEDAVAAARQLFASTDVTSLQS